MQKGTVKWFNTKKGYGFIQSENGEKDIFIHVTQMEKTGLRRLFDGQLVSFEVFKDARSGKIAATEVHLIS